MTNQIRAYREAAGMTQAELAEKLKISPVSLCRYETGARIPRWPEIIAMCEIFADCTPNKLMAVNPTSTPVGSEALQGKKT